MSTATTCWGLLAPDGAFFKFANTNFFIGRSPDFDLTLKSRSVDKRHAVITADFTRNVFQLHDLGTLNGTFVNEVCIRRVVTLKPSDNIRFGYDVSTYRVEVYPVGPSSSPEGSFLQANDDRLWEINNNTKEEYQTVHQPYPPYSCSVPPDCYPPSPTYHHPPLVTCPCPTYHPPSGPHPQLNSPRANFGTYGFHGYPAWPHMVAPFTHSSHSPRLPAARPATAFEERSEVVTTRSPLYGQPPWWGWGSDDEVYTYPHTSSLIEDAQASPDVPTSQHTVMLRKKRLLTKKEAVNVAHNSHTVAVVSESREQIFTRSSGPPLEARRTNGNGSESVVYRGKAAIPLTSTESQLSPVFEQCTSGDWETVEAARRRERLLGNSGEAMKACSDEDGAAPNSFRNSLTYEIPFIPDFDEIPERPVNERAERTAAAKEKDGEARNASPRRKGTTRIRRRPGVERTERGCQSAGRRASTSSGASDTTSGSESEGPGHRSRARRSGAAAPRPHARVFGLTEVHSDGLETSDRGGLQKNSRQTPSPDPSLPGWAQRRSGTSEVLLVSGSSSAAEDSLSSSMTSTGSFMRGVQGVASTGANGSGENHMKDSRSSSERSRPRAATTGTAPRSSSLSRSYSAPTKPSKASPSSPQVSRSKTMTAAVRRSYPSAPRSRSASSVSDESEAERHNEASPRLHTRDAKTGSEESGRRTDQPGTDNKSPSTKFTPRGNKTAMLRAQSSRENLRNASKGKSPPFARPRSAKPPSPSPNPASSPSPTIKRVTRSPLDHRAVNSFDFSSEAVKGLSQRQEDTPLNGSYDSAQDAVDEIFRSAGHSSALPESLQMKREDPVNRTFVLDDGQSQDSPSQTSTDNAAPPSPATPDPTPYVSPNPEGEGDGQGNSRAQSRLIPFALLSPTGSFPPPFPDKPFAPPSDTRSESSVSSVADSKSLSPTKSPSSPPSVERSKVGGEGPSQARRQWDFTDKPVEDLMLSSIHAFSVELRLASDSVLSKVKSLYEGNEEFPGDGQQRGSSEGKQEPQSAIPDWKSSHAEIAGVFRNLRKVELRLRTMDQALSIMCQSSAKKEPDQAPERRFSMADMAKLGSQNWREFKIRARRNSWAIEHRNQFPVPAESEEEEEDSP